MQLPKMENEIYKKIKSGLLVIEIIILWIQVLVYHKDIFQNI